MIRIAPKTAHHFFISGILLAGLAYNKYMLVRLLLKSGRAPVRSLPLILKAALNCGFQNFYNKSRCISKKFRQLSETKIKFLCNPLIAGLF